MANQVVVSPLLELVSDKLANLIEKDFGVAWGVQKQMEKLSKTLSKIKYVLVDAEKKQVIDLKIRDWLQELKDVSYAADDVFEKWEYDGLLQVFPEMRKNSSLVIDSLKELMESFDDIATESRVFCLHEGVVETTTLLTEQVCPGRETGSVLTEQVFGREKDKQKLVSLLLDQYRCRPSHPRSQMPLPNKANSPKDISICPILGIGGLGKTTLAQLVYNDEQVEKHFNVRSWVCVSNDFDIKRLMRAIIASVSGAACAFEEMDLLQRHLQEKLYGKRYLLVLDDVWEDDLDKWNKLKGTLACEVEGSCVIVTTRLKKVAFITGTLPHQHLKPLSEDDCWSLFKQRAFGPEEKERPDLIEIGKKIVEKCKGVPLAAKALGASLRFKREPRQWLNVKNNEIWQLLGNDILPALRLSYNHLSPELRQCFAYCAIYKKNHKINRKELIYMWIANGFVQSRGSMERLEDVGNEIFEALLWRSFFQDMTRGEDGDITTCKMHDLVHDLACDVAGNECSIVDGGSTKNITRRTRHLSQFQSTSVEFLAKCPPSLRSFLIGNPMLLEESQLIFSRLICLRVLDLRGRPIMMPSTTLVLPDNIDNMKHLRYLNLSWNPITSLPESICKLIHLETLNLQGCCKLKTLPKDMSEMSRLRHLDNSVCFSLTKMPIGMGKLTCLQTLSSFVVGLESGGGINELGGLNKIEGSLEIRRLEKVKNPRDAKEANLLQMENLCSLGMFWGHIFNPFEKACDNATKVMKDLQPPPNLRRFLVQGYNGVSFPSLLLPKLVQMKLLRCSSLKFIDEGGDDALSAGGFESLEELDLQEMPELEGLSSSSSSQTGGGESDQQQAADEEEAAKLLFPCLKKLRLRHCPKLMSIPLPSSVEYVMLQECNQSVLGQLKNLPQLSHLEISGFLKLECFPQGMLLNLPVLRKLEIHYFNEVEALPEGFMNLSSLRSLHIDHCDCLKQLPKMNKSCLEDLKISYCEELEFNMEEDFQNLVALQTLTLEYLPKLARFPEGMKQAVMLKDLSISECSKEVIDLPDWIGTLTALQELSIEGCKNRKVLPEGMQHLIALRELTIRGCDTELERRCERYTGEDWSKIAHVPSVYVEAEMVIDNGDEEMDSDGGDEDTGSDSGDDETDSGDEEMPSDGGDDDMGSDSGAELVQKKCNDNNRGNGRPPYGEDVVPSLVGGGGGDLAAAEFQPIMTSNRKEPKQFNDFLRSLCEFCRENHLTSFCENSLPLDRHIMLITKAEAVDSDPKEDEALKFLGQY